MYEQVALGMFTQRRHRDIPSGTTDEFKIRNPVLFLNRQIKEEFLRYTQAVNPATGNRDRLDGTAPLAYYTCTDWGRHDDFWYNIELEDISAFLERPNLQDIKRVEIFINHDQMCNEVLGYYLEDINSNYSSDSTSGGYDEIHIIYEDREETTIGIQRAEFTIIKDTNKGVYKTTFVRQIADEVGDTEEIMEVTETPGWAIDEELPHKEHERVIKRAEEERGRYFKDGEWCDTLGPLDVVKKVKSDPWRPGNVRKTNHWEDDDYDELEEEDDEGFTLAEIAEMSGLFP